jgi:PAS domain S-box-containing protein
MNSSDYLRDSEQGFRLIFGSIPGLVWTMTAGGDVEFVNQQLLDYTGKTREELRDWRPLMHPDDRERVMFQWTRSIQTGNAYEIEHRIRRADGVYRWFQVRGRPLRDMEGRMVRWYNLVTDIDELKKTDEKLRLSEECLLEAQRLSHTGSWQHDVVSGWSPSRRKSIKSSVAGLMRIRRPLNFGLTGFILRTEGPFSKCLKEAKGRRPIIKQTTALFFPTVPSSTSMLSAILS